ncbi:MAG: hypothetical protein JKY48_13490 [Flavobacteriales bacterium]|nr:hypothetical protein [Flavobacteriales bacterium]
MKKGLLLSLLICTCNLLLVGQSKSEKVDIKWGIEQKVSKKTVLDNIIGSDESGIYIIKKNHKGKIPILIERYDHDMNLSKSVPVTLGEKKKARSYQAVTEVNGEILLFSTILDKGSKTNLLFVQTLNKKTLKPSSILKKIGEIDYENGSKRNSGSFRYEVSNNKKKILIYYKLPYEKGGKEKVSYHIYDSKLNLLWEKDLTLPYKQELFTVFDYEVRENGDLYLLSRIYKDKVREVRNGKPNYEYLIIAYTDKGNSVTEFPIAIKEHFLRDMQIAVNKNGDIICGGFYSENQVSISKRANAFEQNSISTNSSIKGSYFLKIDGKTKEIISKSFKEFGLDFITENLTDRQEKKVKRKKAKGKRVELYQYALDNIVLREDGGAILVGEQYYVQITTTTNSQGQTNTSYHYFYNDIILVKLSPSGEIDWTEKIAKRQHTVNDGGFYSSYSLSVVNDNLYFVFNDNIKNLFGNTYSGKDKGKIKYFTKKAKESVAVLVEVDGDGRQVKEALFSAKETDLLIRPKVCEQTSDNELIIYGQKRKNQRLGKITFLD